MSSAPHDRDGREDDPTLVRNQKALTSSGGGIWLGVGAVMAAICVGVLLLQLRNSLTQPLVAAGGVIVAYAAMVAVRLAVAPGRPRLVALAVLFAAIPVWTLVWIFVIVATR
jgi:hypothetical protein